MKSIFLLIIVATFAFACGSAGNGQRNDHSNMNHSNMPHPPGGHPMNSSVGADGAPFELQFLDTMVEHHQAAVDMANLADARAESSELRELAKDIVADQEREIMQMSKWREQWYAEKQKAVNMTFTGMHEGMSGMDTNKLTNLKGKAFDIEFVRQMIPHHEGAVKMAETVIAGNARPEVKELARGVISAQRGEVEKMKAWQAAWTK